MVIPQAHHENHALGEGRGHIGHTTLLLESVAIAKGRLLGVAKGGVNGIAGHTIDQGLRVGNSLAVLDIIALNVEGIAATLECGNNSEFLASIDGLALAIEAGVSHAIGVEIAPVRIARTGISRSRVCASASVPVASGLASSGTRVRCVSSSNGVGLPHIHLGAAGTMPSNSCVVVI